MASNTAPVREVIRDGETGELVDFFDSDGIVERVSALLDDEDKRTALGTAARAEMVEHYDLRTICLPRQMDWVKSLAKL